MKNTDLDAAPQQTEAVNAPLSFEQPPDSWLRLLIKFYTQTLAILYFFCWRGRRVGLLPPAFTRSEIFNALPELGCNVNRESFYGVSDEVCKGNNHPVFIKIDPSQNSNSRRCKFGLRSPEDMRRRLLHGICFRAYEEKFVQHRDTLTGFEVFADALQGSKFLKTLNAALKPLYADQKQRFESLFRSCKGIIAGYEADLHNLHATPLPDWTIDKACEFPAILARGIYDADPKDRSKREWARSLGISKASVPATLRRASIKRKTDTIREEVNSTREALDLAREHRAKIMGVEAGGGYMPFDAAMDISDGSVAILQPTAQHEIVSDEKTVVTSAPAKSAFIPVGATMAKRADNMQKPGN